MCVKLQEASSKPKSPFLLLNKYLNQNWHVFYSIVFPHYFNAMSIIIIFEDEIENTIRKTYSMLSNLFIYLFPFIQY